MITNLPFRKLSVPTCDLHALRHVQPADWEKEADLAKSCWWEYRGEHPVNRTLMFAAAYRDLTQRFTGKFIDYTRQDYTSGIKGDLNIFPREVTDDDKTKTTKRRNITALWRARQTADLYQIAYPIYIGACFNHANLNGWQRLPRPAQLYSDRMQEVALAEQELEIQRYIPDFKNPLLKAGSPAPFKREFDEWLYELGKLRPHSDIAYARMAQLGYITEEQASQWTTRASEF